MTSPLETFRQLLVDHLENSSLFADKMLKIDLVLNPEAGALKHRGRLAGLISSLRAASQGRPRQPEGRVRVSTWSTEYAGHETAILAHLWATAQPGELRMVVIAGGDGTSRGALISALGLPREIRESLLFFRLPLGTGNDASETRDWDEALDLLSGRGAPTEPRSLPVIEVLANGHAPHYSFNIASVGIDAFVADLTNHLKAVFPGNTYGLMVDVASFFYEAFVRIVPSKVELTAQGRSVVVWEKTFLLAALGGSGHRTYGSGKKVLPDDDNFCLAAHKNLFEKLSYRKPFYEGTHRSLSGIVLARGDALRVESPVRLPLQMDGEVLWLEPMDFPLTMTIQDAGLRTLALAKASTLS